ncbi:hypothetical protein ABES25_23880 [Bacillus gobiensis]|uniref:hypothetical protein n=1 Tax=Bacillus gobiensis TaxID=1441095 RepID=UPI003D1BBC80
MKGRKIYEKIKNGAEGCRIFRDIGGFVDGTDDQAEFYLAKYSSGNSSVRAWD